MAIEHKATITLLSALLSGYIYAQSTPQSQQSEMLFPTYAEDQLQPGDFGYMRWQIKIRQIAGVNVVNVSTLATSSTVKVRGSPSQFPQSTLTFVCAGAIAKANVRLPYLWTTVRNGAVYYGKNIILQNQQWKLEPGSAWGAQTFFQFSLPSLRSVIQSNGKQKLWITYSAPPDLSYSHVFDMTGVEEIRKFLYCLR